MAFEVEEAPVRERRVNPVLIVILVVLVLGAAGFILYPILFGGDEVVDEAPPVARPAASPTAAPTPAASPTQAPAETFEVFESKDPFRPLVTTGGGTTGGTGTTTGGTTGTGTGTGTAAGSTGGAGGAPAPSGGTRVSVLDILEEGGQQKAQIKVGSTVHTVTPGQTFAGNFKLVSISGNCATLLHGDDKFTLCEGEEVIK